MPAKGFTKMNDEKVRQLKAICRTKPSLMDCAVLLDVDCKTIERYCKKQGKSFVEFRDENMAWSRHMVIRNILKQCEQGNTAMLIFAAKNLCGWKDRNEVETNIEGFKIKIEKCDEKL